MTVKTEPLQAAIDVDSLTFGDDDPTVSVAEAASLLGRDRTRVYALLRSGDLVVAADEEEEVRGPLRIMRASVERWQSAGGASGAPLSSRNAWALIGLASGDQPFSERCVCSSVPKSSRALARGWHAEDSSTLGRGCGGEPR